MPSGATKKKSTTNLEDSQTCDVLRGHRYGNTHKRRDDPSNRDESPLRLFPAVVTVNTPDYGLFTNNDLGQPERLSGS